MFIEALHTVAQTRNNSNAHENKWMNVLPDIVRNKLQYRPMGAD